MRQQGRGSLHRFSQWLAVQRPDKEGGQIAVVGDQQAQSLRILAALPEGLEFSSSTHIR